MLKKIGKFLEWLYIGAWFIAGIVGLYFVFPDMLRAEKYDDTSLGTDIEEIRNDWGEPDGIFEGKNCEIIFHYTKIGIGSDHVFFFDKKSHKLTYKWAGD